MNYDDGTLNMVV